jgi:hypothetical protein
MRHGEQRTAPRWHEEDADRGSLDGPRFSHGCIIWKAIGNFITRIVMAPFRARGARFGGSGGKREKMA